MYNITDGMYYTICSTAVGVYGLMFVKTSKLWENRQILNQVENAPLIYYINSFCKYSNMKHNCREVITNPDRPDLSAALLHRELLNIFIEIAELLNDLMKIIL